MAGYAFISNSTKPTEEKRNSREKVALSNVSKPCLQAALDMGYEVYYGVNRANPENLLCELPVHLYDSHTYRSVTAFADNKVAFKNLSKVVKEGDVEVIHCNTPVGGMVGRMVGKKYHVKKIIYTAHGFHFYKGAPLFNRTVLKWAEQIMAHWTDVIITMNQEDYEAAKKFRLKKGGKVYKVHGVGITLEDYKRLDEVRFNKRIELGLKENDVALISMGDLVPRKGYVTAIKAIAETQNPNLQYYICGVGTDMEKLKQLAIELRIESQIHFLGFREDIKELLQAVDIFLFTTLQEGLPRSMMEAMASGLPCVASKIRGNIDLIEDGKGGFLCNVAEVKAFSEAINKLAHDKKLREQMSSINLREIKKFDVSVVKKEISEIYETILS